ncbi:MAG: helix-turn-helix transcriptional regulator [Candidatus Borkfalkiaceae bacterium]|nr:helix-turn-helix transcriptional regulator [Christensenellaceae bacterium]
MHNKLGKRLKELRVEKNLSQKALAEIIETNNSSVCDWECERTEPSLDTVIKLCEFFDVTADYLLGISDY